MPADVLVKMLAVFIQAQAIRIFQLRMELIFCDDHRAERTRESIAVKSTLGAYYLFYD